MGILNEMEQYLKESYDFEADDGSYYEVDKIEGDVAKVLKYANEDSDPEVIEITFDAKYIPAEKSDGLTPPYPGFYEVELIEDEEYKKIPEDWNIDEYISEYLYDTEGEPEAPYDE